MYSLLLGTELLHGTLSWWPLAINVAPDDLPDYRTFASSFSLINFRKPVPSPQAPGLGQISFKSILPWNDLLSGPTGAPLFKPENKKR